MIFRLALALILGVTLSHPAFAQAPVPSLPPATRSDAAFPAPVAPTLKRAESRMSIPNAIRLSAPPESDLKPAEPGQPLQIGFALPISDELGALVASRRLIWVPIPGGAVATLSVTSPTAAAVRLGLSFRQLPPDAEFRFFGLDDDSLAFGPFSPAEIAAALEPFGPTGSTYWSPVILGDTAAVEVFVPASVDVAQVAFAVTSLSHFTISPAAREDVIQLASVL